MGIVVPKLKENLVLAYRQLKNVYLISNKRTLRCLFLCANVNISCSRLNTITGYRERFE